MPESKTDRAAREGGENEAMGSKEAQRILRNLDKKTKRTYKRKAKR